MNALLAHWLKSLATSDLYEHSRFADLYSFLYDVRFQINLSALGLFNHTLYIFKIAEKFYLIHCLFRFLILQSPQKLTVPAFLFLFYKSST